SGGKMVYNQELKREIPEGWVIKNIGQISKVSAGGDKPKQFSLNKTDRYNIPIYSNGIYNEGLYGYTNSAIIDKQSITISARGTIGYSVLRNKPFVPIIRLIVVLPYEYESTLYIFQSIKKINFNKSGSVQNQLTVPQVSDISIIYPPLEIMKNFSALIASSFNYQEILKEQNNELTELRDWLLPMLMNGQVKVK
ncbi:MAG: restriction endonuclease subunit S, partial [Melioribacteraceae bacterium]